MGRLVEQPSPEAYSISRLAYTQELGNGTQVGAAAIVGDHFTSRPGSPSARMTAESKKV